MTKYWSGFYTMLFSCWISASAYAESDGAPRYQAEPCCQICPVVPTQQASSGMPEGKGIQEGKDGWLFTMVHQVAANERLMSSDRYALLKLFVSQLADKGTTLMLVMPPPRTLMYADKRQTPHDLKRDAAEYQQTLAYFRQVGFLVPAYETLQPSATGTEREPFFFKRDPRWTSAGARQTAELVANTVRQLPLIQQLPEQVFDTQMQGWLKINGTLNNQLSASCGGQRYPLEYTPHYVTKTAGVSTPAATDDILLIGSDLSVENRFNFDGFLQQALSRKVSNRTTRDGNSSLAWMNLLSSAQFQRQPPALILWELPYENRELNSSLLRQLVAQSNDGCEARPVLERSVKTIQGNQLQDLIFGERLLQTDPNELIVDLKLSDPSIEQLLLTLWFSDGGKSEMQIRKNTGFGEAGRFSFVLGNASMPEQRLFVSLDLTLPKAASNKVNVSTRVCRLQDKLLQTAGR